MQTLRKKSQKNWHEARTAMSLGRLVQNIVFSLHLVTEPWTMSHLCGRFKISEIFGSPLVYGSRCIAPFIFNIGARWRWGVSFTSRPFYPQGSGADVSEIIPNLKLSQRLNSITYPRDRSSKRPFTRHSTTWSGCLPENIFSGVLYRLRPPGIVPQNSRALQLVAKSLRQRVRLPCSSFHPACVLHIMPTASFLIQYPKITLVAENFLVSP